ACVFVKQHCANLVTIAQKELWQSRRNADFSASFFGAFRAMREPSCAIVTTFAHTTGAEQGRA
ncbi:MAG: hypothetical protein WBD40_19375, partial [Tepidisphaeraceae bacterium]